LWYGGSTDFSLHAKPARTPWCAKKAKDSLLNEPPLPLSGGSVDTATLELLAAWKAQDATTDPEKLREADEEVAEFKKAMNANRAATGACLLFP